MRGPLRALGTLSTSGDRNRSCVRVHEARDARALRARSFAEREQEALLYRRTRVQLTELISGALPGALISLSRAVSRGATEGHACMRHVQGRRLPLTGLSRHALANFGHRNGAFTGPFPPSPPTSLSR